jgi:hypothetical protein
MAPNGLVMYRSALHGGITPEVLDIFNNSTLMERLKGIKFAVSVPLPFFDLFGVQLTMWCQKREWQMESRLQSATQHTTVSRQSGKDTSTCQPSCVVMARTSRCVTAVVPGGC